MVLESRIVDGEVGGELEKEENCMLNSREFRTPL